MPDDEGSSDKQAEYMKSRKKNVLSLICCIATIAIVFTILGIIIANTSRTAKKSDLTTQRDGVGESGCSGNSFLIEDGVCDEITNNARCLFDGRDCCRQDKILRLCQNCTCILKYNQTDLNMRLKENRVQIYNVQEESGDNNLFDIIYTVEEVASKWICYTICLELKPLANSWTFNKTNNNTCICSSLNGCYRKQDLMSIQEYKDLSNTDIAMHFIMLSAVPMCSADCFVKHRSCGDTFHENLLLGPGLDSLKTETAEHCQKECQNADECKCFDWIPDCELGYGYVHLRKMCMLFRSNMDNFKDNIISGPKHCSTSKTIRSFKTKPLNTNLLGQCSKLNYLQDGYCDDITNIPDCLDDGGDCCCMDFDFSYCSECHCISRNMTETCIDFVETTTTQEMTIPPCFVENRACGRIEDHYQPYDPLDNNIYESTIEGCQKQCQDKEGCECFDWFPNDVAHEVFLDVLHYTNRCYLFPTSADNFNENVISGRPRDCQKYDCFVEARSCGDIDGTNLMPESLANPTYPSLAKECQAKCQQTEGCYCFDWLYEPDSKYKGTDALKLCLLYYTNHDIAKAGEKIVSGPKHCTTK